MVRKAALYRGAHMLNFAKLTGSGAVSCAVVSVQPTTAAHPTRMARFKDPPPGRSSTPRRSSGRYARVVAGKEGGALPRRAFVEAAGVGVTGRVGLFVEVPGSIPGIAPFST